MHTVQGFLEQFKVVVLQPKFTNFKGFYLRYETSEDSEKNLQHCFSDPRHISVYFYPYLSNRFDNIPNKWVFHISRNQLTHFFFRIHLNLFNFFGRFGNYFENFKK